jgi:cob(I)alamin adenosyltransferase
MSESKIYTRSGDKGRTSLFDGTRVSKSAARIEINGALDETNAWIGYARAQVADRLLTSILEYLQHKLYHCTCALADPRTQEGEEIGIAEADVAFLEEAIDRLERVTGPLSQFILPGGSSAAGILHVARTVARRAERRLVALSEREPVRGVESSFVNRLSDLLFAASRYANRLEDAKDTPWQKNPPFPDLSA